MPRDDANLLDIVLAAESIENYIAGMDYSAFRADRKTQSAVYYQLTVIGEAVNRLSICFRDEHPEFPWGAIVGLGNRLVHEYDAVELDLIWTIVKNRIPELKKDIQPFVPEEDSPEDLDTGKELE